MCNVSPYGAQLFEEVKTMEEEKDEDSEDEDSEDEEWEEEE